MTTTETLPQCWQDLSDAIVAGVKRIVLFGPPGLGKTNSSLNFNVDHRGSERVVCNEDMTSADVTGCMMPGDGGLFHWNDGAVLKAWKRGARVVADEVDRASGDVLSLLLAMFDSPESASWTHPITGEVFRPHEDFSVFMTTNVEDMDDLPTALKDRFPVAIRINQPHPDALARLSPDLRQAASLSGDRRGRERISLRSWFSFDQIRQSLGDDRAASLVFRDMAPDILDAIRVNSVTA